MTKKELDAIESILDNIEDSYDKTDPIEMRYFYIRELYQSQYQKKFGHNPLI